MRRETWISSIAVVFFARCSDMTDSDQDKPRWYQLLSPYCVSYGVDPTLYFQSVSFSSRPQLLSAEQDVEFTAKLFIADPLPAALQLFKGSKTPLSFSFSVLTTPLSISKGQLNNSAPLPWPPASLLLFWSDREKEGRKRRKYDGLINPQCLLLSLTAWRRWMVGLWDGWLIYLQLKDMVCKPGRERYSYAPQTRGRCQRRYIFQQNTVGVVGPWRTFRTFR